MKELTKLMISLFLLTSIAYAGEKVTPQRPERIKLGNPASRSLSFIPTDMGVKMGFYRQEGIDLEVLVMKGALIEPALNAGSVNYVGAPGGAERAAAAGLPFKTVFVITDRLAQLLVSKPEIKKPQDARGKTLAVGSIGGSTTFLARSVIKHFGLDPDKDITIVSVGSDMKLGALLSGSVDIATVNSMEGVIAQKRGFNILAKGHEIVQITSIGLATTNSRIRDKRPEIKRMIKATLKGLLYTRDNKGEVVRFMIKDWGYDKDLAGLYYDMEIETYTKNGLTSDKTIMADLEVGRGLGMVKGDVPLSKVVDFSILKEVLKETGVPY